MAQGVKGTTSERVPVAFRFSPTAKRLLSHLAESEGLTTVGYLETTIRRLAKEKGIEIDSPKNS